MAKRGWRVLGVAYRPLDYLPSEITPELERELYLMGLVAIIDPARPEAKEAVKTAREAGIRSVMITGDHALTAEAIARDLGLQEGQKVVTGAESTRWMTPNPGRFQSYIRIRACRQNTSCVWRVLQSQNKSSR
jgi:magnesium-transporting ATPase (P-type)